VISATLPRRLRHAGRAGQEGPARSPRSASWPSGPPRATRSIPRSNRSRELGITIR